MNNWYIRNCVITPALQAINSYSDDRLDMVFTTGAAETLYKNVRQIGGGGALSWFQIERKTHDDLYRFLGQTSKKHILDGLIDLSLGATNFNTLEVNQWYAAACCAIRYMYTPKPLPKAGMIAAQAEYWKLFYNTPEGKGTVGGFMEKVTEVTMS